jgi:hypothetical protein
MRAGCRKDAARGKLSFKMQKPLTLTLSPGVPGEREQEKD